MELKLDFSDSPLKLVNGRHGLFLINSNDYYIGRSFLHYGEYSEMEYAVIEQLVQPGRDIVELGANIGSFSVPLAKKARDSQRSLLVVEPQPVIFQNLCANLALNSLWNVRAENIACADFTGSLFFPPIDYGRPNNFGGISARIEADPKVAVRVRCDTLDNIIPENFDVGLIKIDVEGFELEVLKGAVQTIAHFHPIIYLENDRIEKSQALIEWLWAADYELWWHLPQHCSADNFAGSQENIFGADMTSVNMIAVPPNSALRLQDFRKVESSIWNPVQDMGRA